MMSVEVHGGDISNYHFWHAKHLVERSGLGERIEEMRAELGLKPRQVPFPVNAVIAAMYIQVLSGRDLHWKSCAFAITVKMSDDQLRELGIFEAVNHTDRKLLRQQGAWRDQDDAAVKKAQLRSYQAFYRSWKFVLEAIDGSVFAGHRRRKLPRSEVKKLKLSATPAHIDRDQNLDEVLNRLFKASIFAYPDGWHGSIVLDETGVPSSRGKSRYFGRDGLHGADPDSSFWQLDRYHEGGPIYSYGATIVKTIPDPQLGGLSVGLGIHWSKPTGGSTAAGVGAIKSALKSGALSGIAGPERVRFVVTDNGYSEKLDFKPGAHKVGFQTVHNYPKKSSNKRTDIGKGVVLFHGAPFCQGAIQLIDSYRDLVAKGASREQQQKLLEKIERLQLVRRGLPKPTPDRPAHRPKANGASSSTEEVYNITLHCPAALGRVSCPLDASCAARLAAGKPEMPDAPTPVDAPEVCTKASTTFNLTATQYKAWQVAMVGGSKHTAYMSGARSGDEAFHAYMKSGVGARFREDTFLTVTKPALAVFTALIAAGVNRQLQEKRGISTLPPGVNQRRAS